jgi:hypothetical protein
MAGNRQRGKGGGRRKHNVYGVHARNYPASCKDAVDFDYWDKQEMQVPDPTRGDMTPKEWLAKAADEIIGAKKGPDPLHTDPDVWRELYREKNSRNRDIFSQRKYTGQLVHMDEEAFDLMPGDPVVSTEPTPEYLSSLTYKEALAEYRKAVDAKDHVALQAWGRVLTNISMRDIDGDNGGEAC